MVTRQQVLDALAKVMSPHGVPLTDANVLSEIAVNDGRVFFSINVEAREVRAWEAVRGQAEAAVKAILGFDAVMKLSRALAHTFGEHGSELIRFCIINGLPGFISREGDGQIQTTALDMEDGKISAIYVMRNPDKLKHIR